MWGRSDVRIRSIKPEFWKSDDTTSLKDWNDRLLFIGLWSYVDDNGVGRDNERLITAELFGLEDDPREASTRVRRGLERIAKQGLITRYSDAEGRRFLHVTNWHHQKIDRPSAPRYPLPTSENALFDEPSTNTQRALDEDSLRARKDQGSGNKGTEDQGAREQPTRAHRIPDTFHLSDSMRVWAKEHAPLLNIERHTDNFIDHWRSTNRNAAKTDWLATWRKWMRSEQDKAEIAQRGGSGPPNRNQQSRPSTTNARVNEAAAAGARLMAALESQPSLEITA
jgi:hypothetical protein